MRFSCQKEDLQNALSIVQKAVNAQNTLQILGNILLKAEGQKLYLSATNLEIAISTNIDAQVENEGSITIPARLISSYIGFLKKGEVSVSLNNGDSIEIKSDDAKTKLKGLSADEFPELPKISEAFSFEVTEPILKKALERVIFSCSASSTRPVLSGALFWGAANTLRIVGTDSYRLGEQKIDLEMEVPDQKYIIPARTLQELSRILSSDDEKKVTIKVSDNQVVFLSGNTEISSRLIEGNFPEYQRIIPETHTGTHSFTKDDALLAVKRAGLFAKEIDNNTIKIQIEDGKIHISTDETEIGSGDTNISVNSDGDGVVLALNAAYLLDIINVLSTDEIVFETGESLSPLKIRAKDDETFVHIIMPLKV